MYSVYGQHSAEAHIDDARIATYRDRWLSELLLDSQIEAVVSFGRSAAVAYRQRADQHGARARELAFEALTHPTMPEAASQAIGSSVRER